jgi:uncharacterized protein
MALPSIREIEALHKKYAPTTEVFDLVFTHCRIVCAIAEQLMQAHGVPVDHDLVRVGCWLHDIGVYPLFDEKGKEREDLHYITHGTKGESILKNEGFPEAIWRFASHHTGVGLSRHDIVSQNLPLPPADYEAATPEERLVMYADKFHSKTDPPYFNSYDWYRHSVAKFGADKVAKFEQLAEEFGLPDLGPLAEQYGHQVR